MGVFNLPPGCTLAEINGPPMPRCAKCGLEFSPKLDETVCDECSEAIAELLGCPWCGNQPTLNAMKYRNAGRVFGHKIRCDTCNFEKSIMPPCWGEGEEQFVMDAAKSQLVEWWNTCKRLADVEIKDSIKTKELNILIQENNVIRAENERLSLSLLAKDFPPLPEIKPITTVLKRIEKGLCKL